MVRRHHWFASHATQAIFRVCVVHCCALHTNSRTISFLPKENSFFRSLGKYERLRASLTCSLREIGANSDRHELRSISIQIFVPNYVRLVSEKSMSAQVDTFWELAVTAGMGSFSMKSGTTSYWSESKPFEISFQTSLVKSEAENCVGTDVNSCRSTSSPGSSLPIWLGTSLGIFHTSLL